MSIIRTKIGRKKRILCLAAAVKYLALLHRRRSNMETHRRGSCLGRVGKPDNSRHFSARRLVVPKYDASELCGRVPWQTYRQTSQLVSSRKTYVLMLWFPGSCYARVCTRRFGMITQRERVIIHL